MRVGKHFHGIAMAAVHLAWLAGCASGTDADGANAGRNAVPIAGAAADSGSGAPSSAAAGSPFAPAATGASGSGLTGPASSGSGGDSASAGGTAGAGAEPPTAGAGAEPPTAGMGGTAASAGSPSGAGMGGTAGSGPVAGMPSASGAGATAGMDAAGASADASPLTGGTCCGDGNCICRDDDTPQLTSRGGPYRVASVAADLVGTIFYPSDADPPFAGLAIIPGFLNSGPEMRPWCDFYASHGIVCTMTNSLPTDIPQVRAVKLLDGVEAMKAANEDSGSPLFGKMSGRYATTGYSMGGGGTTIAAGEDASLKASVGLAAWGGVGLGVTVPTLLLCGSTDIVAPCSMSSGVYTSMGADIPKMQVTCALQDHLTWFGPTDCSGPLALAFMKRYLEGDERWQPLLFERVSGATLDDTNIQ